MLKRIISAVICISLLFLCGCSKDTGEGKRLVLPIDEAPSYLDPQIVSGASGRLIVANCFEGLVRLDENGGLAPAAAQEWTVSSDRTVYTFKLRSDATWCLTKAAKTFLGDEQAEKFNRAVTADDFVFALQRAVTPETGSAYALSLSSIKNAEDIISGKKKATSLGVKAEDDYTLVITLVSPDDDFLSVLTSPVAMPCNREFFEKTGGRYGVSTSYLIYNGPFYISSWLADSGATIKKNTEFKGYEVSPESVYFSLNSEQETRLEKIGSGTYDIAPLTAAQVLSASENDELTVYPFKDGIKALMFNCKNELMSNLSLRKAFTLSLDTQALSGKSDIGVVPNACTAGGLDYREKAGAIKLLKSNDAQALELWSEALSQLDITGVSVSVLCSTDDETAVKKAMQTWQALFGIALDVKCEAVDSETLLARVSACDYQIAFSPLLGASAFASDFMSRFMSASVENTLGFSDSGYDSIMSKALSASSTDVLIAQLHKAEQYLINKCAIVPIDDVTNYYGCAKGVSAVVFSSAGDLVYFPYAKRVD